MDLAKDSRGSTLPPAGRLASALDLLARFCMLVAGVQMVVLIAIFGWLVYGRYVLNATPTWVEQLALLLVAYITFLGAAVGVHRGSHLGIDFIREALPPGPRRVLRHLADLLVLVFGGFMAWYGWQLVGTNLQRPIPMLGLAESWRAAPLALCGALVVLFAGARIAARLAGRDPEGA